MLDALGRSHTASLLYRIFALYAIYAGLAFPYPLFVILCSLFSIRPLPLCLFPTHRYSRAELA